jgi:hypothetical protein
MIRSVKPMKLGCREAIGVATSRGLWLGNWHSGLLGQISGNEGLSVSNSKSKMMKAFEGWKKNSGNQPTVRK